MKTSLMDKISLDFEKLIMDRVEDNLCAIHYNLVRDVGIISKQIIDQMEMIHFTDLAVGLEKITNHFRKYRSIDTTTLSSMTTEFLAIQLTSNHTDQSTCSTLHDRLQRVIFETIIMVAQRNLWLDEDGKHQLIEESNRPYPMIRFWDRYAAHVKGPANACESYGLDMKLRFHNFATARNYNIPPAKETSLLQKLLDRDINLLSTFPRILQTNKKAVLIAIGHFQKNRVSQEDYIANFSQMSTALQNDQEVFDAACSHPRSIPLVKMLCHHLRYDDRRFLKLIDKQGSLLQFATERQQDSKEFVMQAIRADPGAYIYASNARKEDQEILLHLVLDGVKKGIALDSLKKTPSKIRCSFARKIIDLATSILKGLAQIFQTFGNSFNISSVKNIMGKVAF